MARQGWPWRQPIRATSAASAIATMAARVRCLHMRARVARDAGGVVAIFDGRAGSADERSVNASTQIGAILIVRPHNTAMEALMGLIGGLVGAVLGAWCAVAFPRAASRRQVALQLLERYTSPDFFIARAETWKIRHAWAHGDRSCLAFFIRTDETFNSPDAESRCANGLTPHQNLSWLLHFFVSVQAYQEAGLLDARLAATLLAPH